MTVGIAAMCHWLDAPMIVAASDRMITAGDIEFEPPQSKIYPLTNSIVMLIAGDTAAQTDIRTSVGAAVSSRLAIDQSWMRVEEAMQLVSRATVSLHRRLAERSILEPLGLTFDTFIARQAQLHPEVLTSILRRVEASRPGIQTIVAGVDEGGAHIYEILSDGSWLNSDAAAFSAIGAGSRHAESEFMFARHTATRHYPETQLLTYTAKRRAEVAPGVGLDTDMIFIFGLGGYNPVIEVELGRLRGVYENTQRRHEAATAEADRENQAFFTAMVERVRRQARPADEQQPTVEQPPVGEIGPGHAPPEVPPPPAAADPPAAAPPEDEGQ